jgi:DNA-binding NtrC family response regulator
MAGDRVHQQQQVGRNQGVVERILLQTALEASRGRRVEAASRLGIGRNTITRKLRDLGIEDE